MLEDYYAGQIERAEEAVKQYEEPAKKSDEDKKTIMRLIGEIKRSLDEFKAENTISA